MCRDLTNIIGYIYKITSPNGKVYIGQTLNFKNRKYYYSSGNFKQQIKLQNSVNFYNWSPIDNIQIIEECFCGKDKVILNEREIFWISYFDSFKNGLNCNEGGCGNIGHKHTDETKKKISEAHFGKKHSEERNKKKSEYTKGRKHTDDAREKMSITKKIKMNDNIKNKIRIGLIGNKNGVGNKGGSKRIICLSNGKIYDSIKQASIELNIGIMGIINTCKGKQNQIKGYNFEYYEK